MADRPSRITDPSQLRWHRGIGSQRFTFVDPDSLVKITEFPRDIGVAFLVESFDDRRSYKVTSSAVYPSLEAALEGAQS